MPIPKPTNGEKEKDFISRCMGDKIMLQDYPDNKQRAGVCYTVWKNKDKNEDKKMTEIRTFPIEEIREADEGKIVGYAAMFNKWSQNLGGFKEIIRNTAFSRSLEEGADVRFTFNHDKNYVLGRTTSKTLSLSTDKKGLQVENTPPETVWAQDLITSVKRGDIDQMSFAFDVPKGGDKWYSKDGETKRELSDVNLHDVSIVTYPAYLQTSVAVREIMEAEGIDADKLQGIMLRHNKIEDSLSDGDREYIQSIIEVLNGYLRETPETSEDVQADGLDDALAAILADWPTLRSRVDRNTKMIDILTE